jgi:hypothetical protein
MARAAQPASYGILSVKRLDIRPRVGGLAVCTLMSACCNFKTLVLPRNLLF